MRGERAARTFNDMCRLAGHRLSAPARWCRCKPCMGMTSGDHEFGVRFVEKLQMQGERAERTFNDRRQELDE